MKTPLAILLVTLFFGTALAQNTSVSSGSGVVVGNGNILTNFHVVDGCANINAQLFNNDAEPAVVVARDRENDLAIVRIKSTSSSFVHFREGAHVRVGDTIIALGYPPSGVLASAANLSVGVVNALAGLKDDSRYIQISAPVQPGNSGGPLVDTSGRLVGIVTGKLDAMRVPRFTGDIPQNVNFAIKAEVATAFLQSRSIEYKTAPSEQQLTAADVADLARPFTAYIECRHGSPPKIVTAPQSQSEKPVYEPNKRVSDFVSKFFAVWSGPNSAVLPALKELYADEVTYYGKRISLQAVLRDKQDFIARWPRRTYKILPEAVSIECKSETQLCRISGLLEWVAANGPRQSSGIARFGYVVSTTDRLTVVFEDGAVVKRYSSPASARGSLSF